MGSRVPLKLTNISPVFAETLSAGITIGNSAVVSAGDIAMRAWTFDAIPLGAFAIDEASDQTLALLEAIAPYFTVLPFKALVKSAAATVTIGTNATLSASGTGSIRSSPRRT